MRTVIFDLGHTLIDYHHDWRGPEGKAIERTYEILASRYPSPPDKEAFTRYLGERLENARRTKFSTLREIKLEDLLKDCFSHFNCNGDNGVIQESLEEFYRSIAEYRCLFPGTIEMLKRLKENGYRVGLISDVAWGLPSMYSRRDIDHYRLGQFFDDMIFSSDAGYRKPCRRLFEMSMRNLETSPEESMYVGNSLQADVVGAKNAGMKAVLKESSFYLHDDAIVPDVRIRDWDDLFSYLEL
jgi:putative hydrolase of the HAD superfamily